MGDPEVQTGDHPDTVNEPRDLGSIPCETSCRHETEQINGRVQLLHGPFSYCNCMGCMEDAKKEAEKRFDNNTFTFEYIKKLEALVTKLQIEANEDDSNDSDDEVYYKGRLHRRSSVGSGRDFFDPRKTAGSCGPFVPLEVPEDTVVVNNKDSEDRKGPKMEIKRMKTFWDNFGHARIERDRALPNAQSALDPSNEHVVTVFREYDKKKNYWRRTLQIKSPPFIDLLHSVAYPSIDLPAADDMLRLKEPFMPLVHNRHQLVKALQVNNADNSELVTAQTIKHTRFILGFLETDYSDVVKIQNDLETCGPSGLVKYEHAWLLYAPGTIVFSQENGEYEAFVVESIRGCQRHLPSSRSRYTHSTMEITCWSINYDGEVFGRVWSNHYLAPFDGSKEICSLGLVPEAFVPNLDAIKASLVERGQQFWALQGQCFKEYTGEVWSSSTSEQPIRVMVDHLTYQRRHDWPIEIDQKRGPANAQSKNWRENKFNRRHRHGRYGSSYSPRPPHPRRARRYRNVNALGDDEDGMYMEPPPAPDQERYDKAYERVECDRPPQASNALFKKYDILGPETWPDEMVKLLCPQIVHGYCLRDKVWSEYR